jgi:DNA-binding PadR family transcriptional regulator
MVTRLEEKGLVRRIADSNDRRAVQAALTEEGRALVAQLEQERDARFARILERMSEEEREALLGGLRRFVLLAADSDATTANDICLRCGWHASADCPLSEIIPVFACR